MKAATLKEIKTELSTLHPVKVLNLCMHLAKYKKENKDKVYAKEFINFLNKYDSEASEVEVRDFYF